MKIKRKLLASAMFDCGDTKTALDIPVVSMFIDYENNIIDITCNQGGVKKHAYENGFPVKYINKLGYIKDVKNCLRCALKKTITTYKGKKVITDYHQNERYHFLIGEFLKAKKLIK